MSIPRSITGITHPEPFLLEQGPVAGPGRRAVVGAATVLATGALTAGTASASPSAHRRKPTIVLVHGAWAGPASWHAVGRRLRRGGYQTVAPTLPLLSEADDIGVVKGALDAISGVELIVAHSYGGIVVSGAAAGRTDVLGLVYSAAFVPDRGDSIASLGTGFAASPAFKHLAFTGAPFASPAYIAPNLFRQYFAQDLSVAEAALLDATQTPLNFPIVTTPSGPAAWHTLPSWYAVSGADRMIDPAEERWMATRAGATTVEYPDASHVGGLTRDAGRFTALIERAVHATTH